MKKAIAVIFAALALTMSITACSGTNNSPRKSKSTYSSTKTYDLFDDSSSDYKTSSRAESYREESSENEVSYRESSLSDSSVPEKPELYDTTVMCSACDCQGYTTCTYCNGKGYCSVEVLGETATYQCSCGGTGKIECFRCNGNGSYKTFNIHPRPGSTELKEVDRAIFETAWSYYIQYRYYEQGVEFDVYYDYIFNQAQLDILNGGTGSNINYEISGAGSSSFDVSDFADETDRNYHGTVCAKCRGHQTVTCPSCHGTGSLSTTKYAPNYGMGGDNSYQVDQKCPACNGSKEVLCTACNGKGYY